MSTTTTTGPTTTNAAITQATDTSSLVSGLKVAASNGASEVPQVIQAIMLAFPQFAAQQSAWSATPIGSALGTLVGGIASHYGLNYGTGTDDALAFVGLLIGGYVTHWVQARMTKAKVVAAASNAP